MLKSRPVLYRTEHGINEKKIPSYNRLFTVSIKANCFTNVAVNTVSNLQPETKVSMLTRYSCIQAVTELTDCLINITEA